MRASPLTRAIAFLLLFPFLSTLLPQRRAHAGIEEVSKAESFNFSDASPAIPTALDASTARATTALRTAPVSAQGTFTTRFSFDVPPGRLGMTPSAVLSYDSAGARRPSPFGAGWTLDLPTISRAVDRGAPPVKVVGSSLSYDDAAASFDSPDGQLVPAPDGPGGDATNVFMPERETRPVRYKYLSTIPGGAWIQYEPNGTKRFFGRDGISGREARVVNDLGAFAWLLLVEIDTHGNHVEYDYHNIAEQGRADKTKLQRLPVLSKVEWGGNIYNGAPHIYFLRTLVSDQQGNADLLHGGTLLSDKVDRVEIGSGTSVFWTYQLALRQSPDTGRWLLREVKRSAPGEADRATSFSYSQNPNGVKFGAAAPLPGSAGGALAGIYSDVSRLPSWDPNSKTVLGALSPSGIRYGHKFVDFDGDGATDILYHPAGLQTTQSQVLWSSSVLQSTDSTGKVTWSAPKAVFPPAPVAPEKVAGIPDVHLTQLLDVDGDADADAVEYEGRAYSTDTSLATAPPADLDYCFSAGFWERCGFVDPLPPGGGLPGGGIDVGGGLGFDRRLGLNPLMPKLLLAKDDLVSRIPRLGFGLTGGGFDIDGLPGGGGPPGDPDPGGLPGGGGGGGGLDPKGNCVPLVTRCRGVDLDTYTKYGSYTTMKVRLHPNSSKVAGVTFPSEQTLPSWPKGAIQTVVVEKVLVDKRVEYRPKVFTDFQAPFADLNADGRPDLVVMRKLNSSGPFGGARYTFVPTVYMTEATDSSALFSTEYSAKRPSRFELSLKDVLQAGKGVCLGDSCNWEALYPPALNFNAILQDVNGDNLPDLIVSHAPIPTASDPDRKICVDGHRVYLNRGHRFELRTEKVFPGETWTSGKGGGLDPTPFANPLLYLRNRNDRCSPITNLSDISFSWTAPMSTASFVDINADGLTDIVFAFAAKTALHQEVFLNTGRGYRRAGEYLANFTQPFLPRAETHGKDFYLALFLDAELTAFKEPTWRDTARFVDLDGDGLQDIVYPGVCSDPGFGRPPICEAPTWSRNLSVVPDLLTEVSSTGGSWMSATYVAATSAEAKTLDVVRSPGDVRPDQFVVASVRRAGGPSGVPDAAAVEEISLRYKNFVRDRQRLDAVGFEEITETYRNSFNGTKTDTLVVTKRYDVRETLTGISVRFPGRGVILATESVSGAHTTTRSVVPAYSKLGTAGVRVRPSLSNERECEGAVCATAGQEVTAVDGYGFATRVIAGNVGAGGGVVLDGQAQENLYSYTHLTADWILGLQQSLLVRGYFESVSGAATPFAELSKRSFTYYATGDVETETRSNLAASPSCDAFPNQDVTFHQYDAFGLPILRRDVGRRDIQYSYDAQHLYVASRSTTVTHYVDGAAAGSSVLSEQYEYDLRHGGVTKVTDANAFVHTATFDSHGRKLVEIGPGGAVLENHSYQDQYPAHKLDFVDTGDGKFYLRKSHFDGEGHLLGVVEGRGDAETPFARTARSRYDAFGRPVETYHKAFTSGLDSYVLSSEAPKTTTTFDGFGRLVSVLRPSGSVVRWTYGPRSTDERNERGFLTRSEFDWRGLLTRFTRFGMSDLAVSTHSLVRDGAGSVIRIVDGDGTVRRIERDGAGRIHRLELPHAAASSGLVSTYCYDADDQLSAGVTSGGRSVAIIRDELGRAVKETTTDSAGAINEVFSTYDVPTANSMGTLARIVDDSGAYDFAYDEHGHKKRIKYSISPALLPVATPGQPTNVPPVASTFEAIYDYNFRGQLRSLSILGLPSALELRYSRDAMGRPTSVTSGGGVPDQLLAKDAVYDAYGRLRAVSYGNGTSAEWAFDPITNRLDSIRHFDGGKAIYGHISYGYDAKGNPTLEVRKNGGSTVYTQKINAFDPLDRLESSTLITPTGTKAETFAYTAGGNIKTAADTTYTYGKPSNAQAVTSVLATGGRKRDLTYGNDGELVRDITTESTGEASDKTLAYDPAGCLRSIVNTAIDSSKTAVITGSSYFTCGFDGELVARKSVTAGGSDTRISFIGIGEIRPEKGIFVLRVPLNGSTVVEEARSLSDGTRVTVESGYIHSDLRGSVLAMTSYSAPGHVRTHEAEYDAWGHRTATSSLPLPRHGFLDQEPDPVSGSYHLGRRVYDPSLRRWLSPDPLFHALPELDQFDGEQLNLYAYAANNPVRYGDRSGLQASAALQVGAEAGKESAASLATKGIQIGTRGFLVNLVITVVLIPGNVTAKQLTFTPVEEYGVCGGSQSKAVDATADGPQSKSDDTSVTDSAPTGEDNSSEGSGKKEEKFVPNPYGKKGGPDHQKKVEDVAKDVESRGLKPKFEYKFNTPGGTKEKRYADVVGEDDKGEVKEVHQVGKQTKGEKPVSREKKAIEDINNSPDLPPGVVPQFHPYNLIIPNGIMQPTGGEVLKAGKWKF